MNQWKGLFWKEWCTMKSGLYIMLVLNVIAIIGIPFLLHQFVNIPYVDASIAIGVIWIMFHNIGGAILLLSSLEGDMKRPDMWLHSTASIFKLTGVKFVFAIFITMISLLWNDFLLFIVNVGGESQIGVDLSQLIELGIYFTVATVISSIVTMTIVFFFWVIVHLLKPYLKNFAIVVSVILFFIVQGLFAKLFTSNVMEEIPGFGKVELPQPTYFEMYNNNTSFYSGDFYISDVLLSILALIVIYVGSAKWFEKKVRL